MSNDKIPTVLKKRAQWVTWQYEDDPNHPDKPKKIPKNPRTGGNAQSDNPETWGTYAAAVRSAARRKHAGIGFMFAKDDPFAGVDLDDCIEPDDTMATWAAEIVADLDSYTEISPSGTGVKIWVEGTITQSVKTPQVELYAERRFFTVTGRHVEGTPTEIRHANGALQALYERYKKSTPEDTTHTAPTPPNTAPASDHAARWAEEKMRWVCEQMTGEGEGNLHNRRLELGKLAGGIVAHGLISAEEAERRIYDARLPKSHHAEERKAIRDGIATGKGSPLTLPTFPTEQALIIQDEEARCPSCNTPVQRSKYAYPGTDTPGWYCPQCKHPMVWPLEAWTPVEATKEENAQVDDNTQEDKPKRGATHTPSQRIIAQFGAFGYTFRLNRAGNRIEINGEPITDELAAEIRTRFRDEGFRSMGAVQDVYITEAIRNAYHPVQDYLNGLEWDGKPHIGRLAALLPCSDPEIVYPDKSRRSTTAVFLYRWLIGAVAKALDGHQHVMLVLSGPQGCGKSELVRWLGSPLPDYFIESPLIPGDRDNDVRLITRWIWEVSELDATTRRADVSALKAFITKQRVSVRKAYGHFDTTAPALACFIGTINPDSGFLTDPTGNRRFWILNLTGLDWGYTKMSIDQIWAEAVAAYRRGVPHTLLPSEAVVRDDINREHDIESLLESWIQKHFWITHEPEHRMTAADIVDHLRSKEIRLNGSERGIAMDLSRVMAHLQVSKERTTRWRGYVGIMPVPEA